MDGDLDAMKPPLRLAGPTDVELLASLMAEFYAESGTPFDRPLAAAAFGGLVEDPSLGRVWLVVDPEPVGYIAVTFGFSLEFSGHDAFIDDLFLRAGARGAGLGTRVLEAVEVECRAVGIRALHLEVGRSNEVARRLYRKQGFRETDRLLLSKRLPG